MAAIDVQAGSEAYRLGERLWDYLRVRRATPSLVTGTPAETLLMVLGSPDLAVANHAADLLKRGAADYAVISGGCPLPGTKPGKVEADEIAELIEVHGIDSDRLLREPDSQNTSDHFWKTEFLLRGRPDVLGGENPPKFVILVPAPIAERRALATGRNRWWTSEFQVDGIPETYRHYMERMRDRRATALSRMVGEIERIRTYPALRYMTEPDATVTPEVKDAYRRLRRNFHARLIQDPQNLLHVPAAV